MLIEHPAAWSAKAFPDDRLPEAIRRSVRRQVRSYPNARPLLIRQQHPYQSSPELRGFLVHSRERSPEIFRLKGNTYQELLGSEPQSWEKPLYLVCTHGAHDKCCAKFGFATYCATRRLAAENVWECTHVGGDRFAGNVICLPHGIYYGNVFPEDAAAVVDAYEKNQLVLKHYRGRSCYPKAAQAGEYFVRAGSGLLGLDDLHFLESIDMGAIGKQVRFQSTLTNEIHEVQFQLRPAALPELLTCKSLDRQFVTQFQLTHHRVFSA